MMGQVLRSVLSILSLWEHRRVLSQTKTAVTSLATITLRSHYLGRYTHTYTLMQFQGNHGFPED